MVLRIRANEFQDTRTGETFEIRGFRRLLTPEEAEMIFRCWKDREWTMVVSSRAGNPHTRHYILFGADVPAEKEELQEAGR